MRPRKGVSDHRWTHVATTLRSGLSDPGSVAGALGGVADVIDQLAYLVNDLERQTARIAQNVEDRESLSEFRIAERIAEVRHHVENDVDRLTGRLVDRIDALDRRVGELTSAPEILTLAQFVEAEASTIRSMVADISEAVHGMTTDVAQLRAQVSETDGGQTTLREEFAEALGRVQEAHQADLAKLMTHVLEEARRDTREQIDEHRARLDGRDESSAEPVDLTIVATPPPITTRGEPVRVSKVIGDTESEARSKKRSILGGRKKS